MTEIILVRHGETEWNAGKIYRGRVDINLNKLGIKQAGLLGEYLSNTKLDAIYSSPLRRALDTANIIAQHQRIGAHVTGDLIDLSYGEWQGLSEQKVRKSYPDLHDEWLTNPHRVRMPSGESLADVRERGIKVINEVTPKYKGTVALVSHRVVNKVLICFLLGLDNSHFWNIKQDLAGITTFSYEGGRFILTKHNDTSHLKGIQKYGLTDF